MSTSAAITAPAATAPVLWKVLLVLPALAHAAAFGVSLLTYASTEPVEFRMLDLLVQLVILGHLAVVLFVAGSRRATFWLLTLTYLALAGVASAELLCRSLMPPSPPALPHLPLRQRATVGLGFGELSEQTYDVSINSLGLRGPEVDFHAADVKILCVGGSTTECRYLSDEDTWPWALQDKLAGELGLTVFVGNAGKRDYNTLSIERLLREYTDGNQLIPNFDWVVVLCGFDDWGNELTTAEAYELQHIRELAVSLTLVYPDPSPLYYRQTGLLRVLKRTFMPLDDPYGFWLPQQREKRAKLIADRQILYKLPEGLPNLLKVYQTNLKAIKTACEERGSKLLLLTQPTLYRETLPAEYQRLLWRIDKEQELAPSLDYLEKMNKRYNQALLEFCRREGVAHLDLAARLSNRFKTTEEFCDLFYDDCHFNVSGCDVASEILAEGLAAKLRQ